MIKVTRRRNKLVVMKWPIEAVPSSPDNILEGILWRRPFFALSRFHSIVLH